MWLVGWYVDAALATHGSYAALADALLVFLGAPLYVLAIPPMLEVVRIGCRRWALLANANPVPRIQL